MKKFENRIIFSEVMAKSLVSCFFWLTVYIRHKRLLRYFVWLQSKVATDILLNAEGGHVPQCPIAGEANAERCSQGGSSDGYLYCSSLLYNWTSETSVGRPWSSLTVLYRLSCTVPTTHHCSPRSCTVLIDLTILPPSRDWPAAMNARVIGRSYVVPMWGHWASTCPQCDLMGSSCMWCESCL